MPRLWFATQLHSIDEGRPYQQFSTVPGGHSHFVTFLLPLAAFILSLFKWGKSAFGALSFLCNNYSRTLYLQNCNSPKLNLMEQNQQDFISNSSNQTLLSLPNATTSLVLGILSIVICGVGFILGIIGIVLANKDIAMYRSNPGVYSESSFSNAKTGRICSIIGIIVSSLIVIGYVLYMIWIFSIINSIKDSSL